VLHLLGDGRPTLTARLLSYLRLLGYSDSQSDQALANLTSSLLVRATDAEVYESSRRPTGLFVSEAGKYFRDNLLSNPDYLLSVVLDVPLEHSELRLAMRQMTGDDHRSADFILSLRSLVEYAGDVRKKETNQVFRLLKSRGSPELRRVTFSLRKGGLLLSCLRTALQQIVDRGHHAVSPRIKDATEGLHSVLKDLDQAIDTMESKLDEADNKGREERTQAPSDESRRVGDVEFGISLKPDAEGMALDVAVQTEGDRPIMLIGVMPADGEASFPQGTVAQPLLEDESGRWRRLEERARVELKAPSLTLPSGVQGLRLQGIGLSERTASRVGLLSPALVDGKFALQLRTPSQNGRRFEVQDIGKALTQTEVAELGRSIREKVSSATTSQFAEQLLIQGSRLATEVLTPHGRNILSTQYRAIDTLVVLVPEMGLDVPWEWLRPTPQHEDLDRRQLLCQQWRIIRWPASPVDAVHRLREADHTVAVGSLTTFGLGNSSAWRQELPTTLGELRAITDPFETIHLVGHYVEQNDELILKTGETRLVIGVDAAKAIPILSKGKCVILSGCSVGAAPHTTNLAIALANDYECFVWTPVVPIDERDASELDMKLHEYLRSSPQETVDNFFMSRNRTNGWTNVYVRYGFGAPDIN
jgi:hypothetical protein